MTTRPLPKGGMSSVGPSIFSKPLTKAALSPLRAENVADGDAGLARGDLLAVIEAAAQQLDGAAGRVDGDARRRRRDDLAGAMALHRGEGAGDMLLRVEEVEPAAAERRPGAGRRVAAADQIVDGLDMMAPVDARFRFAHPAFVGRLAFVLRLLPSLARSDEIGGLEQRRHAQRKDLVEIDAAQRVVGEDLDFLLQDDGTFVEP